MSASANKVRDSQKPPVTVYLIDASIYIFQAHFSPYVQYTGSNGDELSALYGFTQSLLQIRHHTRASHFAVAFDESLFCGFRHQLCPNYKSNRKLPDENLAMQLAACSRISSILGFASFGSKTYEADDILGTIASRVRTETQQATAITIVSKDKDLAQLIVNPGDNVWDYSSNRKRYWQDIIDDFGVTPAQLPDFLGLAGDSVDRISGVPGVGPTKAKKLLNEFNSLDGIYQNLHRVSSMDLRGAARLQQQLEQFRDAAQLSKRLATIVCDVQDPQEEFSRVGLAQMECDAPDLKELGAFLEACAFHRQDQKRILDSASAFPKN